MAIYVESQKLIKRASFLIPDNNAINNGSACSGFQRDRVVSSM